MKTSNEVLEYLHRAFKSLTTEELARIAARDLADFTHVILIHYLGDEVISLETR